MLLVVILFVDIPDRVTFHLIFVLWVVLSACKLYSYQVTADTEKVIKRYESYIAGDISEKIRLVTRNPLVDHIV